MLPRPGSRRLTARKMCCPREGRQDSRSAGRDAGPYRHKQHLAMTQSYPGIRIPRAKIPGERWPCFPSPLAYEGLPVCSTADPKRMQISRSEKPSSKTGGIEKKTMDNAIESRRCRVKVKESRRKGLLLEVLLGGTKKPPTTKFRHGQRLHCFSRGAGN